MTQFLTLSKPGVTKIS